MQKSCKTYPLKISGIGCVEIKRTCSENKNQISEFNDFASYSVAETAEEALKMAGIEADELDMIMNIAVSYEKMMPEPATMLQKNLNIGNIGIPCMTVQSGDIGFINALDLCAAYFENNRFNRIMIISAEILSTMTNQKKDAFSSSRFSDVAVAVIVTKKSDESQSKIYDAVIKSKTEVEDYSALFSMWQFQKNLAHWERCIKVNPDEFEAHSYELLAETENEYSSEYGLDDVKTVVFPHLVEGYSTLQINDEEKYKVINDTAEFGYHGSSSIPASLYRAIKSGIINRGDTVLLAGVGSGIEAGMIKLIY